MSSVLSVDPEPCPPPARRRSQAALRESLRDLSIQFGLLNHHVGVHLDLKDSDLHCLDLIDRHGPVSPGALARRAGLHPATLTGILDRLERGGWIARVRDPSDRRAVTLRALRDRNGELLGLYSGMNGAVQRICADYDDAQLALLADFVKRVADAGRAANEGLAEG